MTDCGWASPPVASALGRSDSRKEESLRGIRHFLRDFTASAVREHLRSEIEATGRPPELTKNEIELVRFIHEGSLDWSVFLAKLPVALKPRDARADTNARA